LLLIFFFKREIDNGNVRMSGIWEYLMDLEENLMTNQPLQNGLSHFGALHVPDEVFMRTAVAEQLTDLEIWETTVNEDVYYLSTRDPTNHVYAAWLYHVAKGMKMPFNNCERLGDVVEAGWGLLYLAPMFPSNFAEIVEEPNMMWRRIETSIACQKERNQLS
jgi:hypothetical protein